MTLHESYIVGDPPGNMNDAGRAEGKRPISPEAGDDPGVSLRTRGLGMLEGQQTF